MNYTAHKNAQFIFYIGLASQADPTKLLQVNPTIAAGDFKVSTDGAAFADCTNLPAVTPAGGTAVKFILTAAEMNGDNIYVQMIDAAGTEWCSDFANIITTPQDASLVQIDGTANVSATLNLKKLNIVNSSGDAIVASSTGGNGHGFATSGNGSGSGFVGVGGATGHGFFGQGGATSGNGMLAFGAGAGNGFLGQGGATSGQGIYGLGTAGNANGILSQGQGSGSGLSCTGGTTGNGVSLAGGNTSGNGLYTTAQTSGVGIYAIGVGSNAPGILASGGTNSAGLQALGAGSGSGIVGIGGVTGHGLVGQGGATSGDGLIATAVGSGAGAEFTGVGGASLACPQGITGSLETATYTSIADAILKRDFSAITGEASRSLLNCMRALRNKWSFSGNTYTVTKEDNTTPAWTATVTTNVAAAPVDSFTGS